jgi:hypothetical protein
MGASPVRFHDRAPHVHGRRVVAAADLRLVQPVWVRLSLLAAALCAIASAGGLGLDATYARETALWAAQGLGQDLVNLVVIVPSVLTAAWLVGRGSLMGALIWLGLLLYLAYSYVLYAFFVHFNACFLVYVATLGLSAWSFCGAAWHADWRAWAARFSTARGERPLAVLFVSSAALFGVLWLSEILPALAAGAAPQSTIDAGLVVNPVHVLDLAFALPALAVTGVLLWRRRPFGFVAAVPLAAFTIAMAAAITGMAIAVAQRGLGSAAVAAPMTVLAALTVWCTNRVVRSAAGAA